MHEMACYVHGCGYAVTCKWSLMMTMCRALRISIGSGLDDPGHFFAGPSGSHASTKKIVRIDLDRSSEIDKSNGLAPASSMIERCFLVVIY